jgi:succinyl-CoA synthetase beta subunit
MPLLNINEYQAKTIIKNNWPSKTLAILTQSIQADATTQLIEINRLGNNLVLKPDMLFGKRFKNKLVLIGLSPIQTLQKIKTLSSLTTTLKSGHKGILTNFIIEPVVTISPRVEHYLLIKFTKEGDTVTYSNTGGVDIESKSNTLKSVTISKVSDSKTAIEALHIADPKIVEFIESMYQVFVDCGFMEIEINPFVITDQGVYLLDTVAKVDQYALTTNRILREEMIEPIGFGDSGNEFENRTNELNLNSGASLKLNILNPNGRIWGLYSGGGASLALLDTLSNRVNFSLIANYGEYSGNPSYQEVYDYTNIILDAISQTDHGKVNYILIGGAIANFTNVASTLKAISQALDDNTYNLDYTKLRLYVRRSGPHYEQGLKDLNDVCEKNGILSVIHGHDIDLCTIVQLLANNIK